MAILVTVQTVSDADAYFTTRFGSEAWLAVDADTKLAALTTAAQILNQQGWLGEPQGVLSAFPRKLPNTSVYVTPIQVVQAIYEQAFHLVVNPTLLTEEETIETLVLGPLSLQKIESVDLVPKLVLRLISAYTDHGSGFGGHTWWRAN